MSPYFCIQDLYSSRPLPYLIGSVEFLHDESLGLIEVPSDDESSNKANEKEMESSSSSETESESESEEVSVTQIWNIYDIEDLSKKVASFFSTCGVSDCVC